jgi:hypothetical protein
MDAIHEILALLRRQSELEIEILNGREAGIATERVLEGIRRRLAAHPRANYVSRCSFSATQLALNLCRQG